MLKKYDWIGIPVESTWDRFNIMISENGNAVGIKCKFKYSKGGKRDMVEADSSNFDTQLSVCPVAFMTEAAKVTMDHWRQTIHNYYDLKNFLLDEVKEIRQELDKIIDKLAVPKIFEIYTSKQIVEPTEIMKTKYNFTKAIELASLPKTKEFEKYQQFLFKLSNFKYI